MKVLFLLRDPHPGLADHAKISAAALRVEGLSVDLVDCQNWMPTTTDPKLNKETAKRLNSEVNNFDLVHCFGYRTAYAMGEAFKGKKKWVFTAYDSPRTTHDYLIERLNFSRAGFCCSEFVKRPLGWAGVDFLKV
ncbi:MAG: hypothetical protein K8R88_15070, partial [Armatimonadetes bacterium]|nr:hypothetical protein [Armatimonadota bacterium]